MNAVTFILKHEHDSKKYFEATIDLSFANGDWLRTVQKRRKGKDCFIRQHLETCVLTYGAMEFKTGDLCIRSSEQFAGYCDQFLGWEACESQVADYCQKLGFESDASGFVQNLKRWLTEVALEMVRTKPENHELVITEKGEPVLKKPLRKLAPRGFAKLGTAVAERMQESYVLDILCWIDYWTKWTRHLGPFSGADPKMEDAQARYILTAYAYASHLGSYQLASHFHGEITEDVLATINRRACHHRETQIRHPRHYEPFQLLPSSSLRGHGKTGCC